MQWHEEGHNCGQSKKEKQNWEINEIKKKSEVKLVIEKISGDRLPLQIDSCLMHKY